jgi:hypothetical protein
VPILKSCTVCGRLYVPRAGLVGRCPEHQAQANREKNARRAGNRARRIASRRDDPEVRKAMALAVALAGRCSSCGAMPGPGTGVTLHAHWDKRRYGRAHLPVPERFKVVCQGCHNQLTALE